MNDQVSAQGQTLLETLIPHRYVRGPNNGKREGDSYAWDMRRDAAGLEPQLDELSRRFWRYEGERLFALLDEFDRSATCALYVVDAGEGPDQQLHFVFSGKDAMAMVRFRHFVGDCRKLGRPSTAISIDPTLRSA